MKIYVASSWRNTKQQDIVGFLRKNGHIVYDFKNPPNKTDFNWSEVDSNWKNWTTSEFIKNLEHPITQSGFDSDYDAMWDADLCILVTPCGASAHSEAGFMAGSGKQVVVFLTEKQEPELMYKIFTSVVDSIEDLLNEVTIIEDLINEDEL